MAKQIGTYITEVKPQEDPDKAFVRYEIISDGVSTWRQLDDFVVVPGNTVTQLREAVVTAIKAKEEIPE